MHSGVGTWEEAEAKAERGKKKSGSQGGLQTMGLMPPLLSAVLRMGFTVPTPIQRRAIPVLIQNNDVVAMARTGSGKTAAYLIPLFHRLRCEHSTIVGIRGVILSPTRELALQIMRVAKKLAAFTAAAVHKANLGLDEQQGDGNTVMGPATATREGRGVRKAQYKGPLRCVSIVGGTSLDAQFAEMATNPDIVIASPGRLLHLMEEASIKLSVVECVVLDEADRLFELGLQPQIVQLMQRMPDTSVQKCLFSATMPSILAEFANAGLHNPITIRLDAEMKISDKLKQFAFVVRSEEKLAALVFLLKQIVRVRTMRIDEMLALHAPSRRGKMGRKKELNDKMNKQKNDDKRDRDDDDDENDDGDEEIEENDENDVNDDGTLTRRNDCGPQAIVFVESKHHVDLLERILESYAISCSAIHGQMDQEARRLGVQRFARRKVSVMVVTDVAARGLDIPLLDHIINFSFPFNPKLFIHRVGRVARAGRAGCAYSLLTMDDMPYYVDLMRFLERPIRCVKVNQTYDTAIGNNNQSLSDEVPSDIYGFREDEDCYYGRIPPQDLQVEISYINKLRSNDVEVANQFKVAENSHKKYERTKKKASREAQRETHEKRQNQIKLGKLSAEGNNDDDVEVDDNAGLKLSSRLTDGSDYYHTPLHPLLLRTRMTRDEILADAARAQLRNFKSSKEGGGLLELLSGEALFRIPHQETLTGAHQQQHVKEQHQANNNNNTCETAVSTKKNSVNKKCNPFYIATTTALAAPNLSLSELLTLNAQKRKAMRIMGTTTTSAAEPSLSVRYGIFSGSAADTSLDESVGRYKDHDFYLPDEKKDTIEDQHYTVKDAMMDINAETAEDAAQQRSVFAWNKKKNRYQKMHVNDANALIRGMKNEAGKQIKFNKDRLELYSKWLKKSNMRIQDCGEEEDGGTVSRAAQLARTGSYLPDNDNDNDDTTGGDDIYVGKETITGGAAIMGDKLLKSNTVNSIARSKRFNPQDTKDRDAFGNLRRKGVVGTSKRLQNRARAIRPMKDSSSNKYSEDSDYVDISDPNQGRKIKLGRKAKKMPKLGGIRNFDEMIARKKVREAQRHKESRKSASKRRK